MNKPIIIAEVDNLVYNTAAAVTNLLNDEYNTSYSELEFYGDRFKSVIKKDYDSSIAIAIDSVGAQGLAEKREGGDKLQALLDASTVITVSLNRAYRKDTPIKNCDMENLDEPTIYIGTDYETCVGMPTDLRILVKFGIEHKRNHTLGNEDNFYIVNGLQEATEVLSFYIEHPEMIYY